MVTQRTTEQINEAIDQIMTGMKELVDLKPGERLGSLESLMKQLVEAKPAGRLEALDASMNDLAKATVVGRIEALENQSVGNKTELEDMRKRLTEHVEPTIDAVKKLQVETKALTDELSKIKIGLQHMDSSTVNVTTMTAHTGRLEEATPSATER